MTFSFKDRHLLGAGAAACAVCCAAPVLTLLGVGVAGAVATIATFVFAGVVFGLVVGAGALAAFLRQRRQRTRWSPAAPDGPVDVGPSMTRPGDDA